MGQLPLSMPAPGDIKKGPDRPDWIDCESNRLAKSLLDQWPDWPGRWRAINIWGPPACGKTLLAEIFAARTGAQCLVHLCARDRQPAEGRALVLDDVAADERWHEEELLHLVNDVAETGGGLLILSQRPIAGMGWQLPDLASRLRAFASQEIGPPGDGLLRSLMDRYFSVRQCLVPASVLDYVIARMPRSHLAASQLAEQIDKLSLAAQRPVSISLVRSLFERQTDFNFNPDEKGK